MVQDNRRAPVPHLQSRPTWGNSSMPGDLSTRISFKVIFCDRLQQHQMEFHYPPMPGQDAMQEEVWDGGRLFVAC